MTEEEASQTAPSPPAKPPDWPTDRPWPPRGADPSVPLEKVK